MVILEQFGVVKIEFEVCSITFGAADFKSIKASDIKAAPLTDEQKAEILAEYDKRFKKAKPEPVEV